jgi:hypothetical protein
VFSLTIPINTLPNGRVSAFIHYIYAI